MKVYVFTRTISSDEGWLTAPMVNVFTSAEEAAEMFESTRLIYLNDEEDSWIEDWNTKGSGDRDNYSAHYSCRNSGADEMVISVRAQEIKCSTL